MARPANSLVFSEDARNEIINKMPENSLLRKHIETNNYILNLDTFFTANQSYKGFPEMVDHFHQDITSAFYTF